VFEKRPRNELRYRPTVYTCNIAASQYAKPLDRHDAQLVRPLLGRLLLQANTRHLIPVNTPCSQPLCAGLRSSVTHGIGTVNDIPDHPYDRYIYRCRPNA